MRRLDLGGDWTLIRMDTQQEIAAQVPGCVHTDLLAAGLIEDPYYRDNEDRLQWISELDWSYRRSFTVPAELRSYDRLVLRCEGIDTIATIAVNGRRVGSCDNMFRSWEMDIQDAVQVGENTIEVCFASPFQYIRRRQAQRPVFSWKNWGGTREPVGRAWLRREWGGGGPVLYTAGIWRPIYVTAFNRGRLVDSHVRQVHEKGRVDLAIEVTAERVSSEAELAAQVTVTHQGRLVTEANGPIGTDGLALLCCSIPDPKLWWPNGLGQQPLYQVTVRLLDGDGAILDEQVKQIGLRTLELDRHPDQWGESFQFVVNGVPFFAKGANWVPGEALACRMTAEQYRHSLQSAADANMNMLRVWGGGIYEEDVFYQACDELGLCIWQDCMFACHTYPVFDDEFLQNVRAEAEDNIRRLRHHPCMALWCGNNELEQGLVADEWDDHHMSWSDYGKLFDRMLPEIVKKLDPERDYWPSSEHSPCGDRLDFNNPTCGDAHLWQVCFGCQPFETYRECEHRFVSEFGFQSFPEPATVSSYTLPSDRNVTSYVMERHHQGTGPSKSIIIHYLLDWFRLPTSFEMMCWLSQILQGMAMKYAVEHWRRTMPRCMGTLYWQINDTWPSASWSSIDYFGRWKALHFMARRFYDATLVSAVEEPDSGSVHFHVTNDRPSELAGEIRWTLFDVEGRSIACDAVPVRAAARANTPLDPITLARHLEQHMPRNLILWFDLVENDRVLSSDISLFVRPKHLELGEPIITTTLGENGDGSFTITLQAAKPALWTWLHLREGEARFTDNFFHLRPGRPQQVVLTPNHPMSREEIEERLLVSSLFDTYR